MMRRLRVLLLMGFVPQVVPVQAQGVADLPVHVASLVASVESDFDCEVSIHGPPRFDEFSEKWLVAYSASGDRCDDAAEALQRESVPLNALFVRRPGAEEVKAVTAEMVRTVRRSFACHIALQGEPRFDEETSVWFASFRTYGGNCEGAAEELGRQGRELRILFQSLDRPDNAITR